MQTCGYRTRHAPHPHLRLMACTHGCTTSCLQQRSIMISPLQLQVGCYTTWMEVMDICRKSLVHPSNLHQASAHAHTHHNICLNSLKHRHARTHTHSHFRTDSPYCTWYFLKAALYHDAASDFHVWLTGGLRALEQNIKTFYWTAAATAEALSLVVFAFWGRSLSPTWFWQGEGSHFLLLTHGYSYTICTCVKLLQFHTSAIYIIII